MNDKNLTVLTNIISAVESGGQVYGRRRYDAYDPPYKNSPKEHTITIGWAQCYGHEARELIQAIFDADPAGARALDKCSPTIASMLKKDWVAIRWKPSEAQKAVIIAMIDSKTGHAVQDKIFADKMRRLVADCEKDYPDADVKAQMMYCEIRHLGGKDPVNRIFRRCAGYYDLDTIMTALVADQKDKSSNNQVGDTRYWSRHVKCRQFIDQYAEEEKETAAPVEEKKEAKMAEITEKTIKICGHGSGNPRVIDMYTYNASRYARKASGNGKTWRRGVVAVRRYKGLTDKQRAAFVAKYKTILGRNLYSQTLRGYCYKPYKDGRYYSDCSSSVCLTFAAIGLSCPTLNTVGIYQSRLFESVPVIIRDGHIANPEILKVGDCILYAGADAYRPLHIGHVEAVCSMPGGGTDPEPVEDKKGVRGLQSFLSQYYPSICIQTTGDLLLVDGDYGPKTRAAALAVWKHMANKYYGAGLTVGNANFFETSKAAGDKMTLTEVRKHGTLAAILQGLLAARGAYLGDVDGAIGTQTETAIRAYRKSVGLTDSAETGGDLWYKLFN